MPGHRASLPWRLRRPNVLSFPSVFPGAFSQPPLEGLPALRGPSVSLRLKFLFKGPSLPVLPIILEWSPLSS